MFRLLLIVTVFFLASCSNEEHSSKPLRVLISPYQDLAMFVNAEPLGLEKKYGTDLEFITIPWEDTYTAMLSASPVGDFAFASYSDFLLRAQNLNKGSNDDLLFIYPAYIFKGGAFITFKESVPVLDKSNISDKTAVSHFFDHKIAFPKNTIYEYIVSYLAKSNGVDLNQDRLIDVNFDTALLGAKNGDIDIGAVGLTQMTAAVSDGGPISQDLS